MRIRRVIGAVLLFTALLSAIARVVLRDHWDQLLFVRGWEWVFEHPERLYLAGLACTFAGVVLLLEPARRSRAIAALVCVAGFPPAILFLGGLIASTCETREGRVVHFPDPGQFEEAVALTRGCRELSCDVYVRRGPGEPMERWGDLSYPRCTWPFEVHQSPGQPRYLFVDSEGRAVAVVDLDAEPPQRRSKDMDLEALQDEFGLALAAVSDPAPIRVMTFNIRYDNPGDGENRWNARKNLVVETIRASDPDLLGLQEVLDHQGRYLREELDGYGFVGVGRDDGRTAGEFAPVMYRERRFDLLDSGHFWLSETPEVPGSMGWDAACTRIATWARLRDRQVGRSLLFLNTHWDHVGAEARLQSAKLVKRFLDGQKDPVVVTGDFNAAFGSPPYTLLRETLMDPWRKRRARPVVEEGTFHGFDGEDTGARIDWILCSPSFGPRSGVIDRTSRAGRYPSDHFPVRVQLDWD